MSLAAAEPMTSNVMVSDSTSSASSDVPQPVSSTQPKRLRITIVGGGLGGALAARILRTHHTVTILERTPKATEFGAALLIGPSNMLMLDKLGLNRKSIGCSGIDLVRIWSREEVLVHEHKLDWEETYGDKWVANDRADLRDEFLRLATVPSAELSIEGEPAKIVFGAEVISIDSDSGTVTLKDGSTYESDLVIGLSHLSNIFLLANNVFSTQRCRWYQLCCKSLRLG